MQQSKGLEQKLFIIGFLIVPVTLLLLFVAYPTAELVKMSFTSWDGITTYKHFIGFQNYKEVFTNSPEVWLSFRNNIIYLVITLIFVPVQMIIAVAFNNMKRSNFYKTAFFTPYIINSVAVGYMFSMFLSPIDGGLDGILTAVGMKSLIQNWLSNEHLVMYVIAFIAVWRYSGFNIVIFYASLQSLPKEMFEAAIVDGANEIQKFIYIIIPGIMKTIKIICFMTLAGALGAFELPFIITSGGPNHASSTFITYSIDSAFKYQNFGMACTMGVLLILITSIAGAIQFKVLSKTGS